uniref:Uncharacterized protein n=1 Tax=Opuntia streptacantha TaxID=393608 RepID=A0A7C9AS80_OPUST
MNEVKAEESCISDFGCGRIEAGQLWSEHSNDQAPALYFDADFEKAFKIDDISSVFHSDLVPDIGERKGEPRCGDFGSMLTEDKAVNLHPIGNLSNASEDYILDVDFSKKVPELDYRFCEEWSFRNAISEIHSPATSNEVVRVSEPSAPGPKCISNLVGKSTFGGMHDFHDTKCEGEALVEDEMALKCSLICDLVDVHETDDIQNPLEIDRSLDKSINYTCLSLSTKTSCTSTCMQYDEVCPVNDDMEADELLMNDLSTDSSPEVQIAKSRRKRLSKPPQRYIEGLPLSKSRSHGARKCSSSSSKDKGPRVQSQKTKVARVSECNSEIDSDEEYDPLPSHYNIRKAKRKSDRKKGNNLWTLTEVEALVDGISQFGLGQWTAIKKNFFSSSYRTSTDIRDKWRNLVKTNCRNLKSKREHHRSSAQPLPEAIIQRVKELVNVHSSPRCGSKHQSMLAGTP